MRSWKLVGIAFGLALVLLVEAAAPAAGRAATATEGRVYRGSPYGGRPDKGAATLYRASRKASAPRCRTRNKPTGTVTFSDWQFPDTLNPYQTTRLVTRQIDNTLFEGLFQYDSHARLIPQLASAVPTVGNGGIRDGGRTVVLHLKKGLRWSNGAEITSRDIRFSWQVGMDRATGPDCLGSCDAIKSISTPDRYTAVLHLKSVYSAAVPAALPGYIWPHNWPNGWTNSPHAAALTLAGDSSFNFESARFPTNGPYQVVKVVSNSDIVLHPMKYYDDMTCGASIKNLIFAYYRSKADMIGAAAARKTDVTTDYNRADLGEIDKHRTAYHVHVQTSFGFEHLEFNLDPTYHGKANPLANTRVRLALALALEKYGLIDNALVVDNRTAAGVAAWTPFVNAPDLKQPLVATNPTGQWDPIARRFVIAGSPRAVSDARTLLSRTPYRHGFTLDLYTTSGSPMRQAEEATIAVSWAKLAVKVNPNYVSQSSLLGGWSQGGVADRGKFQVAMFAYLGSPDPDQYKFNLESRYCDRRARTHSIVNGNYSCVRDGLIDRSFTAAARTLNAPARARIYAAVGREVNAQAYWVPLYFRPVIATDDGRVANFSTNPTVLGPTWNVYAWKVKGR